MRDVPDARRRSPVFWFGLLTLAEGWSFVALLIFGSLLSRVTDIDLVRPLGFLHGALFIAWLVAFLIARPKLGWGAGTTLLALVAGLLPLTPFVLHRYKRTELRAAEQT